MKKSFFLSFLILSGCWYRNLDQNQTQKKVALVYFRNGQVRAEVASQPEEQHRGLGGRDSLVKDEGMIFLFATPRRPIFWMKGMRFPLDFIWLNNGRIVDLQRSVPPPNPGTPEDQLPSIIPQSLVDAVLEVNAGFIAENKLAVGDSVKIDLR